LNVIPVDAAISRFRRDLTIAAILRLAFLTAVVACILVGPLSGINGSSTIALVGVGGLWFFLSYRSFQGSRLAADSPGLIAAGEFDAAEHQIDSALRTFSLSKTMKVLSLHHLALLRHAQRRWRESALLCQAILSQKTRGLAGLSRNTRLLMADSMLQLNDLRGAYDAMSGLYRHRLSLGEALSLQLLQLDYGSRLGAWDQMLAAVATKIQLSELMPTENAARSQALLALAAYKKGRIDLAKWLRRRVELLADWNQLAEERPVLKELTGPIG
jgi:hypothetical protein